MTTQFQKRQGRLLLSNCSDPEFKQLDFVVAFPKKKDWFYVMSQPNSVELMR